MPKANIGRAIKKSQDADGANYDEVRYEGFAAGGVGVIVEAMTDNRNRTASPACAAIFTKLGGNLGETGSVSFMFDRVGEIVYKAEAGDADTVMMAAIEAGAEDVESDDEGHWIYCPMENLSEVSDALESELGEATEAKLIWKPQNRTEVDLETAQKLMRLIDTLEDDDDVQSVTANFDVPEDVAAQL